MIRAGGDSDCIEMSGGVDRGLDRRKAAVSSAGVDAPDGGICRSRRERQESEKQQKATGTYQL